MKALIIGATGATGSDLLDQLLADDRFDQVEIFVRRPIEKSHKKLNVHVIDFEKEAEWAHLVQGDVIFSCLGTTLKAAGSKDAQWKVDHDYQYAFAKAAKTNQVPHFILVSSASASSSSRFFYIKMKGQLEDEVIALDFPKTTIFQPPMLVRKGSKRSGEVFAIKALKTLHKIGLFRSYQSMETELLATAMINAVFAEDLETQILNDKAIRNLAQK